MTTRTFKAAGAGNVPRDNNGRWTKGGGSGGGIPRGGSASEKPRYNAAGQRENARGGPIEDGRPQAVDIANGSKMSTRAPRGDERFNDGPEVENALRNTYIEEGMEWDPPVTAAEALGNPKNPNLGSAYKALGEKGGKPAQDRLMHRWRTGQTLPPPRWDDEGENLLPDPWTGPAAKVPGGLLMDNKLGLPSFAGKRKFQFAGGAGNVPRDANGRWTKGGGGGGVADGGGKPGSKPTGGGKYNEIGGGAPGQIEEAALSPRPNTLFSGSTRLQGKTKKPVESAIIEQQGLAAPGHIVVQGAAGNRTYLKPTGKIVGSNSTRPGLVEFDEFEMDTVVRDGTIVGAPGRPIGRQYALVEMFNGIPNYLGN